MEAAVVWLKRHSQWCASPIVLASDPRNRLALQNRPAGKGFGLTLLFGGTAPALGFETLFIYGPSQTISAASPEGPTEPDSLPYL